MKSLYGELKDINISKSVNTIVEAMLQRGENDKVLVFTIRLQAENYKNDHKISKNFNILYYRPSSYTFVGLVEGNSLFPDKLQQNLKRFSYHDSCWRYDGTERIIEVVVDEMLKEIPNGKDSNYSVHTSFDVTKYPGKVVINNDLDENSIYVPLKKTKTLKNKAILKAIEVLDSYDKDGGHFYGNGVFNLRELLSEAKEEIDNER